MLNIVIPMSGSMPFFPEDEYPFPKPLVEINGHPMIQYLIENIKSLEFDIHVTYLVRDDFCRKYHLDSTIGLLSPFPCRIIPVANSTCGALCTSLLATDYIDHPDPVMILNFDQYFLSNFSEMVSYLLTANGDGGCVVFDSAHPRWSFVRILDGEIVEAAEKHPITKSAIAGVYLFKNGADFVVAAKNALLKGASHNGVFYISAVINELILLNKKLLAIETPTQNYFSFYSPGKISEFVSLNS